MTKIIRPVNPPSKCKKCGYCVTGIPNLKGCTCKKVNNTNNQRELLITFSKVISSKRPKGFGISETDVDEFLNNL